MSDSYEKGQGGEKPAVNPHRNAEYRRRGTKLNAIAFWSFAIVEGAYVVFGGYCIFMMLTGWEKVTDFENDANVTGGGDTITMPDSIDLPPIDG
jgi:hypothetical protein